MTYRAPHSQLDPLVPQEQLQLLPSSSPAPCTRCLPLLLWGSAQTVPPLTGLLCLLDSWGIVATLFLEDLCSLVFENTKAPLIYPGVLQPGAGWAQPGDWVVHCARPCWSQRWG